MYIYQNPFYILFDLLICGTRAVGDLIFPPQLLRMQHPEGQNSASISHHLIIIIGDTNCESTTYHLCTLCRSND